MQPANGGNDQAMGQRVGASRDPTAEGDGPSGQGNTGDNGADGGEDPGASNQTEIAVVVSTSSRSSVTAVLQLEEAGPSPGMRNHNSKKRQREESKEEPSSRDGRIGVESSCIGGGASAARKSAGGDSREAGVQMGANAVAQGGISISSEKARVEGRDICRDALKPLFDPEVAENFNRSHSESCPLMSGGRPADPFQAQRSRASIPSTSNGDGARDTPQVVSQDLETEEIRRVRRKENDSSSSRPPKPSLPLSYQTPPPPTGTGTGGGDSGCKEKRARLPNGEAPLSSQANGKDGRWGAAAEASFRGGGALGNGNEPGAATGVVLLGRDGEGKEEGRTRVAGTEKKPNGVIPSRNSVMPPASSVGECAASAPVVTQAKVTPAPPPGKGPRVTRPRFPPHQPAPKGLTPPGREEGDNDGGRGGEATASTGGRVVGEGIPKPKLMEKLDKDVDYRRKAGIVGKGTSEERDYSEGEERGKKAGQGTKGVRCPEHALPVARAFFDFDAVSGFEMRMLPEFFTGRSASKTAEMYMQSRNYMVRSYQRMVETDKNGEAYLTGTECRRKLAGDVCSTLRIHDFLDRFGLINTRTGGRRPSSYPVPPPSAHLWNPTPAPERPSRATKGTFGVGARGREQELGPSPETRPGKGEGYRGGDSDSAEARQHGAPSSGDREWHRKELVRLMEAAVATPDQWETVALQVGGGRTPTACMRQFLNLAVEEVLQEQEDDQGTVPVRGAAPLPSGSKNNTFPDTGSKSSAVHPVAKGGAGADGVAVKILGVSPTDQDTSQAVKSAGEPDPPAGSGSTDRLDAARDSDRQVGVREERPARFGPTAPALMLASVLASSVHPEVLRAATCAATAAAEDVGSQSGARSASGTAAMRSGSVGIGCRSGTSSVAESSTWPLDENIIMRKAATLGPDAERWQGRRDLDTTANGRRYGGSLEAHAFAPWAWKEGFGPSDEVDRRVSRAAAARAAVLSVAGLQARGLAEQEDRRTEALIADLLEARLQRLETKLHCLDELDKVLETERQSLEHDRAELLADQARSILSK